VQTVLAVSANMSPTEIYVTAEAVLPTLRFSRDIGLLLMLTCGIFSSVAGCVFLGLFWPLSRVFGLVIFSFAFPKLLAE